LKSSIVYIDGFNLYYGALKNTRWKWLDLQKYFSMLRQDDEIIKIKYFTAMLYGSKGNKQKTYLLALESLPKVETIYGKFKTKTVECNVTGCNFPGSKLFGIPEEKRTDVNIALHMLKDAFENKCERIILVSGDSDLAPAIQMIKNISANLEIFVYIPANNSFRGAAVELRSIAHKNRTLPNNLFSRAQLPRKIPDGSGGFVLRPDNW